MAEMELEGFDELLARFDDMSKNVANKITKNVLEAGAEPILEDVKETTKFRDMSGDLREGLKIGKIKTKNGGKYIEIGIEKGDLSKIFYGKFIEWGTSQQAERPFLQPALEKNKSKIKEIMLDELRKGLGL